MSNSQNINVKEVEVAANKVVNLLVEISAANETIKNICEDAAEKTGVDKGYIKSIAQMYYKNNAEELKAKNQEVFDLYDQIFGVNS